MPSASRTGDPAPRPPTARGAPPTPMARGSSKTKKPREANQVSVLLAVRHLRTKTRRGCMDGLGGTRFYVVFHAGFVVDISIRSRDPRHVHPHPRITGKG